MDAISYKTVSLNKATVKKEWLVIDATDLVVGRLCSTIAVILRGKHKAGFTPNVDCGDNIILINSEKINFTGNKWASKEYVHHTGYPGGQRFISPEKQLFVGESSQITIPTYIGEITVLPNHMPLITIIKP